MPHTTRATKSLPPPALVAPRQEAAARARWFSEPASEGSAGVGGRTDSPPPAAADAVAPAPPVTVSVQVAQPPAPPPAPPQSVRENVTVEAESPVVQTEAAPASPNAESKEMSNLAVTGRNAAGLMKVMPGMAAAANQGASGLRYTILRRGEGDKDIEVPPDTPFRRHESLHVRIEAAQGGYLYVLTGKRALFAGPVVASQRVLVVARPGVLQAVLLPEADPGPLSTLVSRARQQQMEAVRFQRSDGTHLGVPAEPAPIVAEISILSR